MFALAINGDGIMPLVNGTHKKLWTRRSRFGGGDEHYRFCGGHVRRFACLKWLAAAELCPVAAAAANWSAVCRTRTRTVYRLSGKISCESLDNCRRYLLTQNVIHVSSNACINSVRFQLTFVQNERYMVLTRRKFSCRLHDDEYGSSSSNSSSSWIRDYRTGDKWQQIIHAACSSAFRARGANEPQYTDNTQSVEAPKSNLRKSHAIKCSCRIWPMAATKSNQFACISFVLAGKQYFREQ